MAGLGELQDVYVQSQMQQKRDEQPFQSPVLGTTAQDVNAYAQENPPQDLLSYYMRGGTGNTMQRVVKDVVDRRLRNGLKKKFEELLAQGEQGVDRVYNDAVEKYGAEMVAEYVPPKELFRDPQTGQVDPYKYYEHMALGIKKMKEKIQEDREFKYKQRQQQYREQRLEQLGQYRQERTRLGWAKEIRLAGAENRRERMDRFSRYIRNEQFKLADQKELFDQIQEVNEVMDELKEDARQTKKSMEFKATFDDDGLTQAEQKMIDQRVKDAYEDENTKWKEIQKFLEDEYKEKKKMPRERKQEQSQQKEQPKPQQPLAGPRGEVQPQRRGQPSSYEEVIESLKQTAQGSGEQARKAQQWLQAKGITW